MRKIASYRDPRCRILWVWRIYLILPHMFHLNCACSRLALLGKWDPSAGCAWWDCLHTLWTLLDDVVILDPALLISNNASLCSVPGFGGSVDQNAVIEFIDAGHDMILAADSSASDLIRGIATECGVDFDEASCFLLLWLPGWCLSLSIHTILMARVLIGFRIQRRWLLTTLITLSQMSMVITPWLPVMISSSLMWY